MPYMDFRPTVASPSSSAWSFTTQLLVDGGFAELASGNAIDVALSKFDFTNLPKDITLDGIEIVFDARVASGASGSPHLDFYYSTISDLNRSQVLSGSVLTASASEFKVGGATSFWGYDLRYQELSKTSSGIEVVVTPASAYNRTLYLGDVRLRVHYTVSDYLTGTRSIFLARTKTASGVNIDGGVVFDVNSINGIASNDSFIKRKYNSADMSSQVKSEDVNTLGDALYNIEFAILNQPDAVRASNGKKLYAFSVTITGTIDTPDTSIGAFARVNLDGNLYYDNVNFLNIRRSKMPKISGRIDCHFTSAIGWLVSGSTKSPLYVHSHGFYLKPNSHITGYNYWMSLDVFGEDFYHSITDYESNEPTIGQYYGGYVGSYLEPKKIGAGQVYLKMLALGVEV